MRAGSASPLTRTCLPTCSRSRSSALVNW
jgi:hypothetical protein